MTKQDFSARVNAMMDTLYRVSCAQLAEPQDRRDAIQDALLKAWEKRESLRRPEFFETWLVRILINACHDKQRGMKRAAPLDAAPEPFCDPPDGDAELWDALRRLDEKYRSPILLYYIEGYSVEEAARILRVPRETLKTRLRRGRLALKALLTDPDEGRA